MKLYPGILNKFGGNLNSGILSNFPEILGIFIFLKYNFSCVIDELFGYNLYRTAKKVIDFFITPGILGILENVEEKSQDFLLNRNWKLYSYLCIDINFQGTRFLHV